MINKVEISSGGFFFFLEGIHRCSSEQLFSFLLRIPLPNGGQWPPEQSQVEQLHQRANDNTAIIRQISALQLYFGSATFHRSKGNRPFKFICWPYIWN